MPNNFHPATRKLEPALIPHETEIFLHLILSVDILVPLTNILLKL